MKQSTLIKFQNIVDEFVAWQDEDGSISKERCPYFQKEYKPYFRYMEVPFMARAIYKYFSVTKELKYKLAADKYLLFYLNYVENLVTSEKIAYKFGMALEAAALYAHHNYDQVQAMQTHSQLLFCWLNQLRTKEHGSAFFCGYNGLEFGSADAVNNFACPDVGFSDDLLHVGRGLLRTYELYRGENVKEALLALANYYLTDLKKGTMDGIWSNELGTWAIGPWPHKNFEHIENAAANECAWVFSSFGAPDYLLDLLPYIDDKIFKSNIIDHSKKSLKWIIDQCQFDDGAVGMLMRDDKWVGLTGCLVMLACKLFKVNAFTQEELHQFRLPVKKAYTWLLNNTGSNLPVAGYIKVTGITQPIPGDNVAWLLAHAAESLFIEDDVTLFLGETV
jgi:hypothetical protein